MEPSPSPINTEAELERFRQQWRQEVSQRNRIADAQPAETTKSHKRKETAPPVPASAAKPREVKDYSEDVEPRAYHDLPDKEERLKLGESGQKVDRDVNKEPKTALEHYERAVDKETTGQLGDSLRHYRTAFKLDDGVHEAYKTKHFPPSSFKPKSTKPNPSNASVTVPNTAHHSLHGRDTGDGGFSASLKQLVDSFSTLRIEPRPPPTDASPQEPCHLAALPEEILTQILTYVATSDIAAFARLAQVSKRLAYLVLTEETPWKAVAMGEELGFPAMHYDYACDIEGFSTEANDSIARYLGSYDEQGADDAPPLPEERAVAFSALTEQLLHTAYASSWRQMFRSRPRIRFNGCYISTVNYTRPGATSTNTLTWGTPVLVVTYFRYLRFFRDGTVISLLTTSEPADVVHHLTKENLGQPANTSSALPNSVMKGALPGRWRLSGPASSATLPGTDDSETEGDLHVETEGVVPRLMYKLLLALSHAGKGARNNKLAWKGFWSYNRLTDDWGEFGLRNDRAFYWSRVKSYGASL